MSTASLQDLAEQEPWRTGKGTPRNALDPTWVPSPKDALCDGEIVWKGEDAWWFCKKCGYIGSSPTPLHKPAEHPFEFFVNSMNLYVRKRLTSARPPSQETLINQMLFIAGVALRCAAAERPEKLGVFLEKLLLQC